MAKVVIYARVSTQGQDYERQLAELREYARKMITTTIERLVAWLVVKRVIARVRKR